jgi:hypothetical protein
MQAGSSRGNIEPKMQMNPQGNPPDQPLSSSGRQNVRHPLFGALKDVTFVLPGVDLTEPADPDWGDVYED